MIPEIKEGNPAEISNPNKESKLKEVLTSHDESMDIGGVDSVSLSSVFSDSSDHIDKTNITLSDGRLDLNKIDSWKLLSLNTSRLASLSSRGTADSRKKFQQMIKLQNELCGEDLSTSTLKCGNKKETQKTRKKRRSVQQGQVGGEKGEFSDLLKGMNLI